MKIFTHDEIRERFDKLPEPLRNAMFADINTNLMLELGKKHGLLIDQVGQLADETAYIILGLVHPKDFVARLSERIRIPHEKAIALATDVNAKVFDPIRAHLMRAHDFPAESIPKSKEPPAQAQQPQETGPAPAFRQSSFAMPMAGMTTPLAGKAAPVAGEAAPKQDEKPAAKAPMIFPQKIMDIQKAPDPYREPVE